MKKTLLSIFAITFSLASAQTPCTGGMAGSYPCNGYDLQAYIPYTDMGASNSNDSWGWTDPTDGAEYALVGLDNGVGFIDISDPVNPIYLGKLPTHSSPSLWRDVKTYNNYAFVVSEAGGHGMQVFDLTRLRTVVNPPVTFTEDAHYNGFGSAHNLVINEQEGYAYGVGTSTYAGGPHFVNIQNPLTPVAAGGYSLGSYSHDGQVVTYTGPDTDYTGREIFIGSNETEVVIVDITDKANPLGISTATYSNTAYTHQGWLTEDQTYFLLGDEIDEVNYGFNTRTIVFDFTDLDNPQLSFEYTGTTPATDHNGYVRGNTFYLANYTAGMRVMDISDIENGNMTETGFFDVYPSNDNAGYNGAWNVYPYFNSGNIVITSLFSGGFFLVKSSGSDTTDPIAICQNITVSLDANGQIMVDAGLVDNGSSDDSGFFTLELVPNTFDCSNIGNNAAVLTVTDPSGNTATCNTIITIEDTSNPQVLCPINSAVAYDIGANYYTLPDYVSDGAVTASDNCTSPLSISQDPASGTQLTDGIYAITFETMDDYGNPGICSFDLTVDHLLSISESELSENFSIYPNPSSNLVTVTAEYKQINTIVIYDILGKIIFTDLIINSSTSSIDISAFSKGLYFITINNAITKKIIKE